MFQGKFSQDLAQNKHTYHPLSNTQTEEEYLISQTQQTWQSPPQESAPPTDTNQQTPPWQEQPTTITRPGEYSQPENQQPHNPSQANPEIHPWEEQTAYPQSQPSTPNQQTPQQQTFGQMPPEGSFFILAGDSSLIALENGNLVIKQDDIIVKSYPIIHLSGILLFGNHHLTTPLIKACLNENIPVHFANRMGQYEGALWKAQPIDNSYKGWLKQIAQFDHPQTALQLSQSTVQSRIHNIQHLLKRYSKHQAIAQCLIKLQSLQRKVPQTDNLQSLLGYEGNATKEYYQALTTIIPSWCQFDTRNRRPPKDPFNVLLSYGYTWLNAHTDAILTANGFLTWKGYYHQPSAGHACLASDIMESYRHLIERVALTCVNNKIIQLQDFRIENQQIRLSSIGRKRYLSELEKYFTRPKNQTTHWQNIHKQAASLWQHLDQQQTYQPFMEN